MVNNATKKYLYELDLALNNAPARVAHLVGNGKTVLEIGCASGSQSKVLKEVLGCAVTGIEIDPDAAEDAKRYCDRVIIGNIESMPLEEFLGGLHFDVVIFGDVLEHLRNPAEALRKVKPYLSKSGYLLASIPNIAHASVVFELTRGNFDYRDSGLLDDTHIRFFTKKSVLQLFEAAGYVVADLDRISYSPANTEFSTVPASSEERAILEYILRNNAESQTYQFIIRAFMSSDGQQPLRADAIISQEHIQELSSKLTNQQARVKQLESQIAWIEAKWLYKLLTFFKNLASRNTGNGHD